MIGVTSRTRLPIPTLARRPIPGLENGSLAHPDDEHEECWRTLFAVGTWLGGRMRLKKPVLPLIPQLLVVEIGVDYHARKTDPAFARSKSGRESTRFFLKCP